MQIKPQPGLLLKKSLFCENFNYNLKHVPHPVTYLLDSRDERKNISNELYPAPWFSEKTDDVHSSFISVSKKRLITNGNIKLHLELGSLLTTVLLTVLKEMPKDMYLETAFVNKQILSIRSDE